MEGMPYNSSEHGVAVGMTERSLESVVRLAMRTCPVLDRAQGCSWNDKLCDDEIGVAVDCPGQALRAYRRTTVTAGGESGETMVSDFVVACVPDAPQV